MCRLQCDALHILSANRVCVAARRSGVQAGVGLRRGDDPPRQHAQEDRLVESSCDASLGQRWPAKGRREHHLLSRGAQRKKSKYRVCTVFYSMSCFNGNCAARCARGLLLNVETLFFLTIRIYGYIRLQ